ncbi:MAG TPA: hypothetical protein VGF36_07080 [Rhodopila sp.]
MKTTILAALTVLSLAACSGPTINGQSDSAQLFPGEPHVTHQTGPYDNTANSLGGRNAGTFGGN